MIVIAPNLLSVLKHEGASTKQNFSPLDVNRAQWAIWLCAKPILLLGLVAASWLPGDQNSCVAATTPNHRYHLTVIYLHGPRRGAAISIVNTCVHDCAATGVYVGGNGSQGTLLLSEVITRGWCPINFLKLISCIVITQKHALFWAGLEEWRWWSGDHTRPQRGLRR